MERNGGAEFFHKGSEDEAVFEESREMVRSFSAAEGGLKEDFLPRISSALEISLPRDSPQRIASSRRGLEHCKTAPISNAYDNVPIESHELALLRSKTEKKETPKHDLRLDRLPEHEKKKIIEKLVKIQNNGTVEVDVARSTPVASELLELDAIGGTPNDVEATTIEFNKSVPRLKIAMLVVGTRGDVQPFIAIAKRLQEFGHHVRLATHANFRNFVKSAGIDFFSFGRRSANFGWM